MKQILTLALALLSMVTMQAQTYWNGTSNKTFSGSGTQTDPYLISTPEQLAGLAELCNDPDDPNDFAGKYIKLTADIYLTDFNNPDTASWPQWEPIGHYVRQGFENGFAYSRYFRGHFDGDGHTIYNMYYKGDVDWGGDINLDAHDWENNNMEELENLTWDSWYRGLFCFLEGTAENVTVANARMAGLYIAPLARQVGENAVVRNCHVVNPYMYATQGNNSGFVQDNYGLIENSSVQVNLFGRRNSYGLVGTNHESGIIRDCQVNVTSDSYWCSPVASGNEGLIERTHSTVDITASNASMAAGFVQNNLQHGIIRECSSSGTVRGLGNAPRTAQWSGQIAGFCVRNTGLIESCWTTCDVIRIDGQYNFEMAGFVLANGYNRSGIQYMGEPGYAINCFTAGTLTFSTEEITKGLHPFLQQYNGTSGEAYTPYTCPSRQLNCFWTREGTPQVTGLSHSWAGEEVTLAQLQSQAFVDTLNMIARFFGFSQWEYRPGQLPRPTGVYIQDKTVFFAQGSGTESDPYLVSNKTELEHLAWLVNKGYDFRNEYLKQTADIELNAPESEWSEVAPTKWTTIGKTRNSPYFSVAYPLYFDGSYDGDFHEVKNMYINSSAGNQGLFGNVGSSHGTGGEYGMPQERYNIRPAVIRNLGVTDVYIRATQAGAIAGGLGTKADLIQCWSSGKIYASSAYSNIAGLCGSVYMYSRILNSKTSVELYPISTSDELNSFTGEIGSSQLDSIMNALYTGVYQSTKQGEYLYAFSYGLYKGIYRDSTLSPQNVGWDGTYLYSTKQMQSRELVNALNTNITEWNATHGADRQLDYWKWQENDYPVVSRDTTGLFYKVTFESNGGGSILPMSVVPGSQIKAPARPRKEGYLFHAWYRDEALTDFFDFKRDSVISNMTLYAKWIVDTRGEYDLSPFQNEFATTYHIKTAAQLRGLAVAQRGVYDWSNFSFASSQGSHPTITPPMDFTGKTIVLDNDIFLNDTSDWRQWGNHCYAVPWSPIGQNIPNSGIDITFKGTFDGQGHVIYGMYCEMGATIIGYSDNNYTAQFGLFASINGGTVRNVGVEASVIDLRKHEDTLLPFEATYSESEQKANARYGSRAGMLIGKVAGPCTIEQCYAQGRIIPRGKDPMYQDIGDSYLGGLISNIEGVYSYHTAGTLSNCYARVDITREEEGDIKGYSLVGYGTPTSSSYYCDIAISNCYEAAVCNQGNNFSSTYYNKELIANPTPSTSAKSTYEMHTMNAYANWDFNTIWARNDTVNEGYPVLRIFHPEIENSPDPVTVTGITLQPTSATVISGESIQLNASVLPADAGNQKINWTVSNATYGEVDENGLVQTYYIASKAGGTQSLIVTATTDDGGYVKRCTLNIQYPTVSLKLLKSRRIGETEWGSTQATSITNFYWVYNHEYLVATYTTPVVAHTPVTWTSNNEERMTVEAFVDDTTYMDGATERHGAMAIFRCLATGSATLTATNEAKGYTGKLTRTIKEYPATSLTLTPTSASLFVDETLQLKPTTTPSYATSQIEWVSDNPNVVLVSEMGLVTAVGAGTATVTAMAGSYSATCTFTVESNTFYSIFFVDDDGETELWTTQVREGEMPVYAGPTPTKDSTVSTVYTFAGWDPEIAPATEDALYMATYTSTMRQYIIRFLNYDGTELQTSLEDYGVTPAYMGETPEKPEDDSFTYTFSGWTPEIVNVVADADYTAVFDATEKPAPTCDTLVCDFTTKASSHSNYYDSWTYDNMWEVFGGANNNGSWNYVKMGGKSATLSSANPVYVVNKMPLECEIKAVKVTFPAGSLGISGMSCNSWGVKVYSDLACTNLLYIVNGGTISGSAEELTIVAQEGQPWSAGYAIQVYWDLANTTTSNGIVFVSKMEYLTEAPVIPEPTYYTIRFLNYDGIELQNTQVLEGDLPVYTGATPIRLEDANYTYAFSGWSPSIVTASADADYTAQFTATPKPQPVYYTIRFLNYDGTELQSSQVLEGDMPVYRGTTPTKPEDDDNTYAFSGWLPAIVAASADADYTAQFTATPIPQPVYYTIRFLNYDGTELQSSQVLEGDMPAYTGTTPTKLEDDDNTYAFSGWSPAIVAASADADYTAQFTATQKPQPADPITVRLYPNEWQAVYLYAWTDGGAQPCGAWPGTPVSKDADGWWTYTFDPSIQSVNIIWNNGAGVQTIDITGVIVSTCYRLVDSSIPYNVQIIDCATPVSEGIEDINAEDSTPQKIILNGEIFILRGDKIYTLTGAEVK